MRADGVVAGGVTGGLDRSAVQSDRLIGRARERRSLVESIAAGRHVVVSGSAGIGKTFLVDNVLTPAVSDRSIERLMPGPATSSLPLAALAPLGGPSDVEPGNLPAIVSWYLRHWTDRRRGDPTMLWVDDLQHLDAVSASVIRHAIAADLVHVVATLRTPEPVVAEVETWFTEGLLDRLDLPVLADDDCRKLASKHSPNSLAERQLDRIVSMAAGHPLFVRDLARTVGHDDPALHIDDVVGRRLSSLAPSERAAARAIALAEPVDRRLVDSGAVDALLRLGIVRTAGTGRVKLDHPLYGAWLTDEMGAAAGEVYAELLDAAATHQNAVGAIELATWHWAIDRPLDKDLTEAALRMAFSRADGATARKLAEATPGEIGRLRTGQAIVLAGDVDTGLELLTDVCESDDIDAAVEAAMWASRYFALMLRRFDVAHGLLDRVEQRCLNDSQRRLVLIGRLWLWMFSTGVDPERFDEIQRLADDTAPSDRVTYELAYCGAGLVYQVHGPDAAAPLLHRVAEVEATTTEFLPLDDRCRGAAIQGWAQAYAGDCASGVDVMEAVLDVAVAQHHSGGIALLAGTTCLFAAVSGQIRRALTIAATLDRTTGPDWFRNARLCDLSRVAAQCYAGAIDIDHAVLVPSSADVSDLEPAILARPVALLGQRDQSLYDTARLRPALELLAQGGKRSWLATIAAEVLDLRYEQSLIAWVATELRRSDPDGIAGVTADAMSARVMGDPDRLTDVGESYEIAGFTPAATRAYSDAVRLDADSQHARKALAGLVRCRRSWDGTAMWWLSDIDRLPTEHQVDIASRVVASDARKVAEDLIVSKRTVENHVYRVCSLLGVSGQQELASALAPLQRPANWYFGRRV